MASIYDGVCTCRIYVVVNCCTIKHFEGLGDPEIQFQPRNFLEGWGAGRGCGPYSYIHLKRKFEGLPCQALLVHMH